MCSPVLKKLADSLPDVVHHSKACVTCLKYKRGFEWWRCWATTFSDVTVLPASSVYVTLFFLKLIHDSVSCSIVDEVHYGMKWVHQISGYENLCSSPIVLAVLEAARRLLSVPVKKKEPGTLEIMLSFFIKFGGASATLSDLRLLTLCTLGYAGFLRFSELISLRKCDFEFETSFMRLFIEHSKNDIYRDGARVVIVTTHKPTCPVTQYLNVILRWPSSRQILGSTYFYQPRVLTNFVILRRYRIRGQGKLF